MRMCAQHRERVENGEKEENQPRKTGVDTGSQATKTSLTTTRLQDKPVCKPAHHVQANRDGATRARGGEDEEREKEEKREVKPLSKGVAAT